MVFAPIFVGLTGISIGTLDRRNPLLINRNVMRNNLLDSAPRDKPRFGQTSAASPLSARVCSLDNRPFSIQDTVCKVALILNSIVT